MVETSEARSERRYWNYALNWKRVTTAMNNKSYVAVISIVYACLEDRVNSI